MCWNSVAAVSRATRPLGHTLPWVVIVDSRRAALLAQRSLILSASRLPWNSLAMSKEPTRYQLSSKLAYNSHTPAFLQKLQRRVAGGADEDEDDEYEYDGSGRPPIPRRPSIPERPEGDPGSAGEDDVDEAPQVVVLKEGKHLTAYEAENERRIGAVTARFQPSLC